MIYQKAKDILKNKDSKKLCNNTYLKRLEHNEIGIKLHNTNILIFKPSGDIVLNSDNWQTVTIKNRINKYLPTGFSIYQKDKIWYLYKVKWSKGGIEYGYKDGITIKNSGKIINTISDKQIEGK